MLLADASPARPPAAARGGLAVLPPAGPGAAVTAIARDAMIVASRLDLDEERPGY
jgi:hypothetical protein